MTVPDKPLIAITMGDAAGIGPEVIVKALLAEEIYAVCRPLVIGESGAMERAIALVKKSVRLHTVDTPAQVQSQ